MRVVDLRDGSWQESEALIYLQKRAQLQFDAYEGIVKEIINLVSQRGDEALYELSLKYDGVDLKKLGIEVPKEELKRAYEELPSEVKSALELAAKRVRAFHELELERGFFHQDGGVLCGLKVLPLEKVGVYIPGGKNPYPSSVIMNVLPARVAGVKEIVLCCPKVHKSVLAAAYIVGVDRVFRIGGAQAISAMAFGTKSVPKVDKIVGPGNVFVSLAKRLLFGFVDIDMVAGPSEILIIADESANALWCAWDLLSQAEHDVFSASILITPSEDFAKEVIGHVSSLYKQLPRHEVLEKSIENWCYAFIVKDLMHACEVANFIAPEHLQIATERPLEVFENIKSAGAVFLGHYSAETLGDYLLGPSHTLPTGGSARFFSALGVYDFLKRITFMQVSQTGFKALCEPAMVLANLEGLEAHRMAIEVRCKVWQ
ncbi:MAG: histidinol dehydrogenase [Aquificaceae bacterium]|nr:histidinol dehydrogenase [Aquificaceae bacterium]